MRTPIVLLFSLGMAFEADASAPSLSATLSNHNGYNISCFGLRDGAINLTVTGGTAPYTFAWTNGATTEDISGLAAGLYSVRVKDATNTEVRGDWTLTEPENLKGDVSAYLYPNGYNLSCYQCYNGTITAFPMGGTAPYIYNWSDGVVTQHRYNLGAVQIYLAIADANNCEWTSEVFTLTSPERADWTMSGNAGTTPGTQYLGTTDNKDLVLKTNGAERLRLKSDGAVKAASLEFGHGYRLLMVDSTGQLRLLTDDNGDYYPPATTCQDHGSNLPWTFCGNNVFPTARLGTRNAVPLRLISNDVEHMTLYTNGKIGMGTTPPSGPIDQYRLYVEDGIATRDVQVKLGTWPDFVFKDAYHLMPLDELRHFLRRNHHLPGIPSAAELEIQGGVAVGDMQRRLVQVAEEQALYILELEERLGSLEQRLKALEASK